jgi:hypothetical protein
VVSPDDLQHKGADPELNKAIETSRRTTNIIERNKSMEETKRCQPH